MGAGVWGHARITLGTVIQLSELMGTYTQCVLFSWCKRCLKDAWAMLQSCFTKNNKASGLCLSIISFL